MRREKTAFHQSQNIARVVVSLAKAGGSLETISDPLALARDATTKSILCDWWKTVFSRRRTSTAALTKTYNGKKSDFKNH